MLESEAYKTYHAYATGKKTPKPKKKKANSESSPNEKPAQASKGKRLKTSSKAAQSTKEKQPATKSKAKGFTVLSEVALTEDEQMKLSTKINEGAGDKPKVPDVPEYNSDSEEESWTFSDGDDDADDVNEESDAHDDSDENESDDEDEEKAEDDEDMSEQRPHIPPDYQRFEKSKNQEDDDMEDGEEYGDEEMLYGDLNLNRETIDAGMTEDHATKDTEDANVNLTARVTALEYELSMLKQSNLFAEAISSIPSIVDKYLATNMKEAVDVVVHLKSYKLREEAQAEN
ncbi:hypothetical protein Tco_0921755 [Tanacetum coccineum]